MNPAAAHASPFRPLRPREMTAPIRIRTPPAIAGMSHHGWVAGMSHPRWDSPGSRSPRPIASKPCTPATTPWERSPRRNAGRIAVHDLSSPAVVSSGPRRPELDAGQAIIGRDEQREPVALSVRVGVPGLQHFRRVALDREGRGAVRRERPDGHDAHGIAVLTFEGAGEPLDLLTMGRREEPRFVDDEAARRGLGWERHLAPARADQGPDNEQTREQRLPRDSDPAGIVVVMICSHNTTIDGLGQATKKPVRRDG